MKKSITLIVILVVVNVGLFLNFNSKIHEINSLSNDLKVDVYEVINNSSSNEEMSNKIEDMEFDVTNNYNDLITKFFINIILINGLVIIIYAIYDYRTVVKPFKDLERFASKVAKGNLDEPLLIDRNESFGKFSWSFDLMRETLKESRNREKELIENNKLVIASLSHDIKTPISSIKIATDTLYSDNLAEDKRKKYLSIITSKVDEVTKLTNDLFLHALTDIDKLDVKKESLNLVKCFAKLSDMYGDSIVTSEVANVYLNIEEKRFVQVINNLYENSVKYANGVLNIDFNVNEDLLELTVSDNGDGIDPEFLPFVFDKFYKGDNLQDGAGLGLYIVKYIVESVDGSVSIRNDNGAKFILKFPIINKFS